MEENGLRRLSSWYVVRIWRRYHATLGSCDTNKIVDASESLLLLTERLANQGSDSIRVVSTGKRGAESVSVYVHGRLLWMISNSPDGSVKLKIWSETHAEEIYQSSKKKGKGQ